MRSGRLSNRDSCQADRTLDNRASLFVDPVMHILAFLIELAAIVTPVVGIVIELRRRISDDEGGGPPQRGHRLSQALSGKT